MVAESGIPHGNCSESLAYLVTRDRYSSEAVASKYLAQTMGTSRDCREKRCILEALAELPRGARVLDLPCGPGRLTECLVRRGFRVVGADSSPGMIELAGRNWAALTATDPALRPMASFHVREVLETGYEDGSFDAVVCNRLMHHYPDPELRRAALRELARVCRGTLVVSFFDLWTLDGLRSFLRLCYRRPAYWDRCPISRAKFAADASSAGLKVERFLATLPVISPQTYAVMRRN